MANEKVVIELDLTLPDGSVSKAFGTISNIAKQKGREAGESFGTTFSRTTASFLGNVGAQLFTRALSEIRSQVGQTVAAAQKLEVFEVQFKTLLGSASAARKQLQDLQNFAATTPFQIEGLSLATRQLISFGVAQEKIIPTLSQIGDIAASVGAEISDLTIPYGRLISTQKLTLVELDKFADRGVNLYGELSRASGVSLKNIRDEISKGKIDFELFTNALNRLTSEGGLFFKGAEAQSRTLSGVISTLNDNIFNLQGVIGSTFKDAFIISANLAIKKVQDLTVFIQENSNQIITSFFSIARSINDYVILPIEAILDAGRIAFDGLRAIIQSFIVVTAVAALKIAEPLNAIGAVSDETLESLRDFKDSSVAVFEDFANDTKNSINSAFEGTVYGSGEEFLNNLQANINAARQVIAENPPTPETPEGDASSENSFSTISSFLEGFSSQTEIAKMSVQELEVQIKKFGAESKKALVNGFGSAVGSSFAAFGKALVSGENALEAFGKAFLGSIGQVLVQEGTANILRGIAISANPTTAGAGAPLIAAGAAMATFGGILSGISSGGGATSSGASGNGVVTPSSSIEEDTFDTATQVREPQATVTVNQYGTYLTGAEAGEGIVDLINEAVDGRGVTLRTGVIA